MSGKHASENQTQDMTTNLNTLTVKVRGHTSNCFCLEMGTFVIFDIDAN